MIYHVWPTTDIKEHETDGKLCWCCQDLEVQPNGDLLYTHHYAQQEQWDELAKHQTIEAHGKSWSVGKN